MVPQVSNILANVVGVLAVRLAAGGNYEIMTADQNSATIAAAALQKAGLQVQQNGFFSSFNYPVIYVQNDK